MDNEANAFCAAQSPARGTGMRHRLTELRTAAGQWCCPVLKAAGRLVYRQR